MSGLARYRAMESLCRQSAVFYPLESWRLLAEAEMWHHKAENEAADEQEKQPAAGDHGTMVTLGRFGANPGKAAYFVRAPASRYPTKPP